MSADCTSGDTMLEIDTVTQRLCCQDKIDQVKYPMWILPTTDIFGVCNDNFKCRWQLNSWRHTHYWFYCINEKLKPNHHMSCVTTVEQSGRGEHRTRSIAVFFTYRYCQVHDVSLLVVVIYFIWQLLLQMFPLYSSWLQLCFSARLITPTLAHCVSLPRIVSCV